MFLVSHGQYTDPRLGAKMPANEYVIRPDRVKWFIKRLEYANASDIIFRELSPAEYRERALKTLQAIKCAS